MAVKEHTFSKFLQHSGEILPELAHGPVTLRRRDGEDLLVLSVPQGEWWRQATEVIVDGASHDPAAMNTWLVLLPPETRRQCLHDLSRALKMTFSLGQFEILRDELYAWEATALAVWDESRHRERPEYDAVELSGLPRPERYRTESSG